MGPAHGVSWRLAALSVVLLCAGFTNAQEQAKATGLPVNVHLAVTSDPTEMVVSWLTKLKTSTSMVWYGQVNTDTNVTGSATSYSDKSGWNHNVKLTGLQPDTQYYYLCGDSVMGVTNRLSFRTRPADTSNILVYSILGDMGITNSEDVVARVNQRGASGAWEMVWHLGDISYANDHPWLYEHTWNTWFKRLQPLMTAIPYMVLPGNHESWSRDPFNDPDTFNFSSYEYKFRMPGEESGTGTNLFYSFDYGLVHFIALDTESDWSGAPVDPILPDSPRSIGDDPKMYLQMNWLTADLEKAVANRANVPWIIVGGHRNIYNVNVQKDGVPLKHDKKLQAWLEPLFAQYNVDMFLTGHAHNYQRMWPTLNNQVLQRSYDYPKCTTYIVQGSAGNFEGHEKFVDESEWPDWFAFGDDENYGYSQMTVYNATHLRWEAFRADTDAKIDDILLSRSR